MELLSIDVGGTYTKYAVATEDGILSQKGQIKTQKENSEQFLNSLSRIYYEKKEENQISGIALSMPGFVEAETGFLRTGGFVKCAEGLNIVHELEDRCGIPVSVENDATCAAYAELWKGALKGCASAAVIVCGTGVGGAIIQNHKVVKGNDLLVGEFSYILLRRDGAYRKEDCMGLNTGMHNLLELAAQKSGIEESRLNGEIIFEMANAGNAEMIEAVREYVKNIALLIHNMRFLLGPEKIAIGGGISAQPLLFTLLKEELKKIAAVYSTELAEQVVVPCKFFNDANLIGAIYAHGIKRKDKICFQ